MSNFLSFCCAVVVGMRFTECPSIRLIISKTVIFYNQVTSAYATGLNLGLFTDTAVGDFLA